MGGVPRRGRAHLREKPNAMTDLVIHGHFYQPPRENPWTGVIEREPKVHPFHDWNERIHHECYRTNGFARILDHYQRIEQIVNNFERISFNFGPTLFSWMETYDRTAYERILKADRISAVLNHGHGNAIAQGYGHAILPLCNQRDRLTQVRWGLADFRFRFKREPESLWLPETGANDETLDLLINEGLRYVILAPGQADRVRRPRGRWQSVADGGIDPSRAYRHLHRDGSKRSLAVFFYDGPLARSIAFDRALVSSDALIGAIRRASSGGMVNVAADGETYGHHFKFGDLTLAHALTVAAPEQRFAIMNYG